jgi:hypothetical protein
VVSQFITNWHPAEIVKNPPAEPVALKDLPTRMGAPP